MAHRDFIVYICMGFIGKTENIPMIYFTITYQ